ncbi:threonine synthase [Alicyclobacillus macrosporangiidus]|uniref:threonine synthase n=1 Tax=Alicyclobacillus macrosporangiidus TaxID=392015 RepID=UPI00068F5F5C|nr:threonine synthase [Alicyclobacillus macrosporangiidus]
MNLRCVDCDALFPASMMYHCSHCGGILEVVGLGTGTCGEGNERVSAQPTMWRYGSRLPVEDLSYAVSLGEGITPIHAANRLADSFEFEGRLLLKDEAVNPTGSFKDRMLSVAVSRAKELGFEKVVCASSGNAGASAAAYAAKAGMEAVILAPVHTPREKLTQIAAYGPEVRLVEGHYSNSYRIAQQLSKEFGYANMTTTYINPYAVEALKTVGYELYEQLEGWIPDYVFVPVGAGPLLKGIYRGFTEAREVVGILHGDVEKHKDARIPKLIAVQAEGCAPVVKAYESGLDKVSAWGEPYTIASGISDPLIGYEQDGTHTLQFVKASQGFAISVSDDEILQAMRALAVLEGVFAEPTAACSVAAVKKALQAGAIPQSCSVVCMITAHGFKDFKIYQDMEREHRKCIFPSYPHRPF